MQKILLLGPTYRFPTISPEILLTFLGAGGDLYRGRMGHVRACPGLPSAEGKDGALLLLCTILPRFYLEHSCFVQPITRTHKRKIKTNH